MTNLHSAGRGRYLWWRRLIGALCLAVLLSGPVALAQQAHVAGASPTPPATKAASGKVAMADKAKARTASIKKKTGHKKTAAHAEKRASHKLTAARKRPAISKTAAAKKSAAISKTATAKKPRRAATKIAGRKPAPAVRKVAAASPAAPPSYTITTIRGGVVTRTTQVVAPLAAAATTPAKPAHPAVAATTSAAPAPAKTAAAGALPPVSPHVAAVEAKSAADFVTAFLQRAFVIVRDPDVSALQRRARLGELFAANMNIADIAGYMTADELAAQPPEVQRKFRSVLISYLVETYYPKLEAASDISVTEETTPASPLPDGTAAVWTTFTKRGWGSQSVKWHLAQSGGTFKVKDTVSSGVSLVEMERATFLSVMRNGGVPGLMARLDARTRELASAATD